jgi:redox-sensitive bicupin YhaK (pirin superfamily)
MMMNAGRGFWHEESTPETPVAALQIFIRPLEADLAQRSTTALKDTVLDKRRIVVAGRDVTFAAEAFSATMCVIRLASRRARAAAVAAITPVRRDLALRRHLVRFPQKERTMALHSGSG